MHPPPPPNPARDGRVTDSAKPSATAASDVPGDQCGAGFVGCHAAQKALHMA
jgi:hypothetical protein